MAQKARIKLVGYDINKMNEFIDEVRAITEKLGSGMYGPVPMPTNTLKLTTRKSPDGEGKSSFDRFQMRIHKRLIDVEVNDRVLRMITKIQIPTSGVSIEIKLI